MTVFFAHLSVSVGDMLFKPQEKKQSRLISVQAGLRPSALSHMVFRHLYARRQKVSRRSSRGPHSGAG